VIKWTLLSIFLICITCSPFRYSNKDTQESSYRLVQSYIDYGIIKPPTLHKDSCDDKGVILLIVVPSVVRNFDQIQAIRSTWGNVSNIPTTVVRFLLGKKVPILSTKALLLLKTNYTKTLYLKTYENLTFKSIAMLRLTSLNCHRIQYLLKGHLTLKRIAWTSLAKACE
jgi:hypothetical protein